MTVPIAETQLPYPADDPAGVGALARGLRDARTQLSSFDSEISTARSTVSSWQATAAQAADAKASRLARNGQLVGSALDAAASAANTYADTLTTARISVDGLRDEWSTAGKQLNALIDLGELPAVELAQAQAQADKLTQALEEVTERYNRLVAQVADSVQTCRKAFADAAQAASDTDSDNVVSSAGGLPSSIAADVSALIASGALPPEAAGMTLAEFISHAESDWAGRLDQMPLLPLPAGSLLGSAFSDQFDPTTGLTTPVTTADSLAATFAGMSPEEASWMAVLYPRYLGNRDGVPFELRSQSNRVMMSAELGREQQRLTEYQALDAEAHRDKGFFDWDVWDDDDQDDNIKNSQDRIAFYDNMLNGKVTNYGATAGEPPEINHQVLYFDPAGNGKFAEMFGAIDSDTKNVGVLVPGTGTNMVSGSADRADSFVKESDGKLAMIYWAAGDFPQTIPEAAFSEPNDELAPDLVDFTREVNRTIADTGKDIPLTVAGHSYGGATVGTAEAEGLAADRILFIESAGAGTDVDSINDYHDANPDVRRFSMTAPGDFIEVVQGNPVSPHGADPDELEGLIQLHTGAYPDGYEQDGVDKSGVAIEGWSAHSNVFIPGSDSWNNMYNVFTGGMVTPYIAPTRTVLGYDEYGRPIEGPVEYPDQLPAPVPVDR
jgi:hypothetical protein